MLVDNLERQHAYDTITDRDKADLGKSEGVEQAILDQVDKQQKKSLYDFAKHRVPTNLQNSFTADSRMVQRQDLPPKPVNYQGLKRHPFERRLRTDMEIYIKKQTK